MKKVHESYDIKDRTNSFLMQILYFLNIGF